MKKVQWVSISIASISGMITACGTNENSSPNKAAHTVVQTSGTMPTMTGTKDLTKAFLNARKEATTPIGTTASVRCASFN